MDKIKQSFKENLMNEDKMYQTLITKTTKHHYFNIFSNKLVLSFSIALLLIFAIILSNLPSLDINKTPSTMGVSTPSNKLAYAIVSVDINPSFELYVDLQDIVIEIHPLNDDAKSLTLNKLIGLPVQDVVEDLIKQAQDLGYINLLDTNQDTVIISTISYGSDGVKLVKDIQVKLRSSLAIDRSIKSYILKATDEDREEAKRENVSLGIYMLNGIIQNNGTPMNVQTFVSDLSNLEILEEYAEETTGSELVSVIQVLINELNRLKVDTTTFQTRLNTQGEDLEELIENLKDKFESMGYSESSETENKIESSDDHEDNEPENSEEEHEDNESENSEEHEED
ncbi:MAG TPA: hypothetical protein VFH18_08225 [Erysipelotrichaceae bacterium]|nr:hypothetical protein [Erysipelotrichaceae bacterium]